MGGHSACGCDSRENRASRTQDSTGEEKSTVDTHREEESQGESQERGSNCDLELALKPILIQAAFTSIVRAIRNLCSHHVNTVPRNTG